MMIDFIVVKAPSSYNAILGPPTFNNLKALTSTYHLKMKFPVPTRVSKIHDEQVLAQECYMQELRLTKGEVNVIEPLVDDWILPTHRFTTREEQVRDKQAL